MTKVDCLDNIYNALGGEKPISCNESVCDVLDKISETIPTAIGGGGLEEVAVTITNEESEYDSKFTLIEPTELTAYVDKKSKEFFIHYDFRAKSTTNSINTAEFMDWISHQLFLSFTGKTISMVIEKADMIYTRNLDTGDLHPRFFVKNILSDNKIKFEVELGGGSSTVYENNLLGCGVIRGRLQ